VLAARERAGDLLERGAEVGEDGLAGPADVEGRVGREEQGVDGQRDGAQVDLPGLRARVLPSRHGTRHKAGQVVEHGRHLVISRGVGRRAGRCACAPPPEAPLLRLSAAGRRDLPERPVDRVQDAQHAC
jgi:hypothetical protein